MPAIQAQNNALPAQGLNATEFISGLDIDMPDVLSTLYERRGDQWKKSFMRLLQMFGFELGANQETIIHYEDDTYIRSTRIGTGGVAGAAGASHATVTIPISALDVYTDALGGTHLYPLVGDIWQFPSGSGTDNLQCYVTAVSPSTPSITVKLLKTAWTTGAGFVAGQKMVFVSNAFAEGSGIPKGTIRNVRKQTHRLQIFKSSWEGTGTEMTNGKWVLETSGGQDIRSYYRYNQDQVDYTLQLAMDGAFMFGQSIDTNGIVDPLPEATGRPVRNTEGLVPGISTSGYTVPYTSGAYTTAKFNEMSQNSEYEDGGDSYAFCYGFPLGVEVEDTLVDYNKDTFISYTNQAAMDKVVKIGFKQITKAERTYMFKKLAVLSNPEQWSAGAGFTTNSNLGIVIPLGGQKMYADAAATKSEDRPYLCVRYKSHNGMSRRVVVAEQNGPTFSAMTRPVLSQDISKLFSLSHAGLQRMCLNKFQLIQGT